MFHEFLKLLGGSAFVFACRLSGAVAALITQILLARWMGAEELGVYVLAFSWLMLLSTLAALGYPAASLRFIGKHLSENIPELNAGFILNSRRTVALVSTTVAVLGTGLVLATRNLIPANHLGPFLLAMLSVPIVALFRLHDRIAHAFSWFVLAYLPSMALRPLLFLLFVFLTWFLGTQLSASLVMALQFCALASLALIQYVVLRQGLRRIMEGVKPNYESRLWLRTAAPLLLATLFVQYFPEINIVIIGMILPAEDVAIYYASFRIALFLAFCQTAVNALMIPRASRLHAEGDRGGLQQLVARTTQLRFWLALCGLIVLALYGRTILGWFGEEFVAGYDSLVILALAQLVLAAVGPVDQLLNITGHQDQCLYAFTAALIIAVISNLALVPVFGIVGAAWAVVLVMVVWTLWLHRVVVKQLGIRPSILAYASVFS